MTNNDMQLLFLDILEGDCETLTEEMLKDRIETVVDNLRYAIADVCCDYNLDDWGLMI